MLFFNDPRDGRPSALKGHNPVPLKIRHHMFQGSYVDAVNHPALAQAAFAFSTFFRQDVTFVRLKTHKFAGCRSLEAFSSSAIGLDFWHEFLPGESRPHTLCCVWPNHKNSAPSLRSFLHFSVTPVPCGDHPLTTCLRPCRAAIARALRNPAQQSVFQHADPPGAYRNTPAVYPYRVATAFPGIKTQLKRAMY